MAPKRHSTGSPALKPQHTSTAQGSTSHASNSAHQDSPLSSSSSSSSHRPKSKASSSKASSASSLNTTATAANTSQKRPHSEVDRTEERRMDFSKVDDATIRRYCLLHKPRPPPGSTGTRKVPGEERAMVKRHFDSVPPPYEPDAIAWFLYSYQERRSLKEGSCDTCYRPTHHLLITAAKSGDPAPSTVDWFYSCPSHLADMAFCQLVPGSGPQPPPTPPSASRQAQVNQTKSTQSEDNNTSSSSSSSSSSSQKSPSSSIPPDTPSPKVHQPKLYALHRDIFYLRQRRYMTPSSSSSSSTTTASSSPSSSSSSSFPSVPSQLPQSRRF
ncbi:MAG: hypothetical protein DHS80DRAFT_33623 [Piptocephalis tieghemiana]|nr:MAG: hypothetical protein DHS80DRAFT_33623 [Piptocephalis tieghemiana]